MAGAVNGPVTAGWPDGGSREVEAVIRDLGGRATAGEIMACGTTQWALRTAVRRGNVTRVARGVYALPGMPPSLVAAAGLGGVVSHLSAAQVWGLAHVHPSRRLHVTVPHGHRRAPRRGVVVHRSRHVKSEDLRRGVTSPLLTVLDCATTLPFVQALPVADSALAVTLVRKDELLAAARATKGPGRPVRVRVAEHADGRAANAFESALRAVLAEAGISGFVPQVEIRLAGRAVRVDLADEVNRVVIEADSYEHHGDRESWERDCERYDELTAAGWVVLRFTWRQVVDRPERVTQIVRSTLRHHDARARAGGRPSDTERTVRG
jgi:very-short-patch-repair endonuclease